MIIRAEIDKLMKELKVETASGLDGVATEYLRLGEECVASDLMDYYSVLKW